jgi:hypothetical protein
MSRNQDCLPPKSASNDSSVNSYNEQERAPYGKKSRTTPAQSLYAHFWTAEADIKVIENSFP